MGTTLALNGAYHLAGALVNHSHDLTTAFAEYEKKTRPMVDRAQKLPPGAPYVLNPETAWGISMLNAFLGIIYWCGLANLMFMFFGPPANVVQVEDYGFKHPPELGVE